MKLFEDESGAVAVVVAILMTGLLGMTAFAVDFGMMASEKQAMQNAVDAAALAAAADLGSGAGEAAMRASVGEYCAANGFDPGLAVIEETHLFAGDTVKVTLQKQMEMGFSSALTGQKTRPVSATATAEATTIFGGGPYAMFAGQKIEDGGSGIEISGNNIVINGNIHSNSDISMPHAVLGPGVTATAVRNVSPSTSGWNGGSISLDMPRFSSLENALNDMSEVVEFPGNVTKNSQNGFEKLIEEAVEKYHHMLGTGTQYLYKGLFIHVGGKLTFNGHSSFVYEPSFPITLIVDGDINLNGAPLNSTVDYPITIMSKSGDIVVNGGGCEYTGILYAPEGDVTLNGNDASYVGTIVAQNIYKNGGKITVRYHEDVDRFLPKTKVHLIE